MIYGIVGKPGGGKSYEAVVYHVIPALQSGRKVITNLPLNIPELVKFFQIDSSLIEIRTESLGRRSVKSQGITFNSLDKGKPFSTLECYTDDWRSDTGQGALFIIDECHMVLSKGKTPLEISQWYSMHRHEGFDLMLITQNFNKVDRDICDMLELVFYVAKNTMLGAPKTYTKKVKDGLRGDTVSIEQRTYEKKFFRFYQSHTKSNNAVKEAEVNDVTSLYTKWRRGSLILFIIGGLVLVWAFTSIGHEDKTDLAATSPVAVDSLNSSTTKNYNVVRDRLSSDLSDSVAKSIVENSVKKKEEEEQLIKSSKHPFNNVGLHVGGSFTMNGISSIVFVISQNGQKIGTLLLKDLYLAGYRVSVLNPCLVEYSYGKHFHDYIICDSPQVNVAGIE